MQYQVVKETASMMTGNRQGRQAKLGRQKLDADIYRPVSDQKFPVLLMRQPYGKAIASTIVYAHPRWYAAQGYIVVIQDVRGRGASEGEFELFSNEIDDGFDTVMWAAQLPQSNGKVGMYGFSYQGMTQLYAAINKPEPLKAIAPAMIAYDLYSDWAYENGAFCYHLNLSWAVQLAAETARLKGDASAYKILYLASRNLPLYDHPIAFEEALSKYAPSNFYYEWLNHPKNDQYWQNLSPKTYIENIDLPMLHIGGWFDPYLRGTLNLYEEMSKKSSFKQYLIVGPWGHLPWGNTLGDRFYGQEANSPIDKLQIIWFNKFLKGIENKLFDEPSVCLWEMGSNRWLKSDSYGNKKEIVYHFQSTGLASVSDKNGKLLERENKDNNADTEDVLVFDFWRPTPSLGGHATAPSGSFERSQLDNRTDILTYTSEPLKEDLHIQGVIELEIFVRADIESFDLCAIASEVFPNGKIYNFTQGYIRINKLIKTVKIPFQATCIKISKNHRIRLSLSLGSFPSYQVNLGSQNLQQSVLNLDNKIVTLIVNHGEKNHSKLLLPLV